MTDLDRLRAEHRVWLGSNKLLDRPWFMLASAPGPTIPRRLPAEAATFHIKYAGQTARALGLPPADLTFLYDHNPAGRADGLILNCVLELATRKPTLRRRIRAAFFKSGPRLKRISEVERDAIVDAVVGQGWKGAGTMPRPSNGVAMIAYSIFVGVPEIIVAGLSVLQDGHSYAKDVRFRLHKEEDRAALRTIAGRYEQVWTSEASLAVETGLRVWA